MFTAYSQRWAAPNAKCPVCGAAVYFYWNEHGSRVYFDEMGPPWPKHPCTDSALAAWQTGQKASVPSAYPFAHGRRTLMQARRANPGWSSAYRNRYREPPAQAWVVLAQWPVEEGTVLHLHLAYQYGPPVAWVTLARTHLRAGDLVFIRDGLLSCFDVERFAVLTAPVRYLRELPKKPLVWRIRARLRGESPL